MTMTESEQEEIIRLVTLCENDPLKYAQMAYPWGDGVLEAATGPGKWQANIQIKIKEHLANPLTRYQPLMIAVASGHGIGKSTQVSMLVDLAMKMPDTKIVVTA